MLIIHGDLVSEEGLLVALVDQKEMRVFDACGRPDSARLWISTNVMPSGLTADLNEITFSFQLVAWRVRPFESFGEVTSAPDVRMFSSDTDSACALITLIVSGCLSTSLDR
jgi:hypothetical protein